MPAGLSRASVRVAFSRVSRESSSCHLMRPVELLGGDLGRDLGFGRGVRLAPADAAAEGDRRAGLARQPEAVAQPLERRVLQAADAVLRGERLDPGAEDDDRQRLLRRDLGAQLAHPVEAHRRGRLQEQLAEAARRAAAGREPEQDDADEDQQPAEAAPRQQQPRADQGEKEKGNRRQHERRQDRLPRLDAEHDEEAVHEDACCGVAGRRSGPRLCPSLGPSCRNSRRRGIMARTRSRSDPMSERADALRRQLIRNFDEVPKQRELRPPLYDTECARLGAGTAAVGLGMSIDILAPGMRGCPYHLHHAAGGGLRRPRRARHAARRRRAARDQGRRRRLPAGRPGLSAPDHQHLGRAAEVPVDQHPGAAGDRRVPGFGQVPGDGRRSGGAGLRPDGAPRRRPRLLGRRALSRPGGGGPRARAARAATRRRRGGSAAGRAGATCGPARTPSASGMQAIAAPVRRPRRVQHELRAVAWRRWRPAPRATRSPGSAATPRRRCASRAGAIAK